eukprot:evm.model.NODE_522_length_4510_cov_124.460754.1
MKNPYGAGYNSAGDRARSSTSQRSLYLILAILVLGLLLHEISFLALPTYESSVLSANSSSSAVTGELWAMDPTNSRRFTKPIMFSRRTHEQHQRYRVRITEEEVDKWFEAEAKKDMTPLATLEKQSGVAGCKANKWVVITTIFGPTKLIHQLETLADWCTVVVADTKTPLEEWESILFTRVKLLTIEEQLTLPFKSLQHIPMNHFGRKNIGYLYAIREGATSVYDTDDDNILKTDENGAPLGISIVNAQNPPHKVAQAWHCKFDVEKTRSWNPYALYGQSTAWPRGLPLDDIPETSCPCGHFSVTNQTGSTTYTYQKVFHQLPGISFVVQQSLADVHPDVDAIYRLTRFSPTFEFDSMGDTEGVFGPDNVFAPYNAQATLHEYDAFWAMLLPVSVHGRVSDIWRSYVAQALMWKYGMRVAFMKPWVNQERTVHNYLKDFDSEQPLYLRASALLDFLRTWKPSRENLSLPAEHEELIILLYEHHIIEENDVLLTQAWLHDLQSMNYRFPDSSKNLYDSWSKERFLGGMSMLLDEHSEGKDIRRILPIINDQLSMFPAKKYPVMLFYIDVGGTWMNKTMKSELRTLAPNLRLEFYGTQYAHPHEYPFNSYMFCSQFLSYEIYRHPALQRLTYLLRVDEGVTSFAQDGDRISVDYFEIMSARNLTIVGFQKTHEAASVMGDLCPRSEIFFRKLAKEQLLSPDAWDRVDKTFCSTRELQGGYIELYNLKETFVNPLYFQYIESIDFLQGVYKLNWGEQSFKTIWLSALSTKGNYQYMRDTLPNLKHKDKSW